MKKSCESVYICTFRHLMKDSHPAKFILSSILWEFFCVALTGLSITKHFNDICVLRLGALLLEHFYKFSNLYNNQNTTIFTFSQKYSTARHHQYKTHLHSKSNKLYALWFIYFSNRTFSWWLFQAFVQFPENKHTRRNVDVEMYIIWIINTLDVWMDPTYLLQSISHSDC